MKLLSLLLSFLTEGEGGRGLQTAIWSRCLSVLWTWQVSPQPEVTPGRVPSQRGYLNTPPVRRNTWRLPQPERTPGHVPSPGFPEQAGVEAPHSAGNGEGLAELQHPDIPAMSPSKGAIRRGEWRGIFTGAVTA